MRAFVASGLKQGLEYGSGGNAKGAVLEAIFGVRRNTLHQQDVRFGEPFQRYLQRCVLHSGQKIGNRREPQQTQKPQLQLPQDEHEEPSH
jgi:hypothetical protein